MRMIEYAGYIIYCHENNSGKIWYFKTEVDPLGPKQLLTDISGWIIVGMDDFQDVTMLARRSDDILMRKGTRNYILIATGNKQCPFNIVVE